LWLRDRYKALEVLGKSNKGRTFRVLDKNHFPPIDRFLKQFFSVDSSHFDALVTSLGELGYHPSIPNVIDTFEQDTCSYLVQEWVGGINLRQRVTEQGVLTSDEVWPLLEDILPVLQFIHQRHLVHREVKPANILQVPPSLREREDRVQYILVNWTSLGKDTDRDVVGDAEYVAPEQLQGQAIAASDLYSLGVTCLYCLTGMRPFDLLEGVNNTWTWRTYWLLDAGDPTIQGRAGRLGYILDKLVAFNLSDRYLSAGDVLQAMGHSPSSLPPTPVKEAFFWHCEAILSGHQGLFAAVNAVAFSPDGSAIASGSDDRTVRLWTLKGRRGKEEHTILTGHAQFVKSIAFSPCPPLSLASGSADGMIYLWDIETKQPIYPLQGHGQAVNALAFNPTGDLLASGSADKMIKLWNPQTGESVKTFVGHTLGVTALAFSPKGDILASASQDRTVKLWDLDTDKPRLTLTRHTWAVRAIAFSPDGTAIASGGDDNTILLWDVASRQCLRALSGHSWGVSALGFIETSDHRLILVSGSWDKTIKLWDANTGQPLALLTGHTDSINALAIYPMADSWCLVSGSKDKTLRVWQILL
jgi:WD40 repeat protein